MDHHHDQQGRSFLASRTGKIIAWVALIGLLLIIVDHWAHALGILPYLVLLACPLMHLFGHGHGDHARHRAENQPASEGAAHTQPQSNERT